MAIDDNTSYELTGAQVKDLANKIRSKAADNIFVGATSAIPGSKGLVPQPQAGDDAKFLSGDGLWKTVSQYSLPIASSSTLGGIKVGDNLTIDPVTGVLDADGSTYTAGNGINISANDEISVDTSVVAEVSDLPTKTSDLTNDGSDGTSTYVEADDLATVATSGSYNDLTNKPTIPTVNNATLTVQKNGASVGTFTANASSNKTINITVPTTAADVSALPDTTKYGASILVSIDSTTYKLTTTLKDQDGNTLGTAQVIDLPLESVVVSGAYDSQTKEIVLTLVNGSTIRFSVADLVSGLQAEITSTNKLDADLVDDSTSTHKFTTAANLTKLAGIAAGAEVNVQSDWNVTDSTSDAFIKNKPTIPTVNNGTLTIQKNGTNVQTFTANQSGNATANITVPMGVYTATCSTAAATAAKDIVVPTAQNFELKAGATIVVKFTNTNTANNPTFNVNSTGAKSVYFNTGVITTGSLNRAGYANRYTTYTYDGTNWVWVSWGTDDNTTYSAMSVSEGTTGTATTSRVMRADYLKQIIQGVTPNITMTNTDPGAGSALAANHYVAVYGNSDGTIQTADIANGAVTSAKIGWASLAAGAMASTVVAGSSSTDNGWTVLRIANNVRIYMRYFTGSTTVGASSWGQDDLGTLPSSATSKTWFGFVSGKASDNAVSYTGTIWENGHVAMSKINNYNQQLTVTYEATAIAVVIGV